MRVVIVGSGAMGQTHATGWSATDAQIVGIVSNDQESGKALATKYGADYYPSLDEVLSHIDVVDICLPTNLHREFTIQAAQAGKHVLCEKPIARTVEDGQAMIAACKQAGVRLFIGQVVRFFPQYNAIHQAVANGQIGKPAVIRLTRASYRPRNARDDWFSDFARSGGPLLDMLLHDYDYARWIGGDVERVYARASQADAGGISEYGQVMLRFRSGAIAHIEGGWAYPPPLFRTKVEVAGEGGLIEWESDNTTPFNAYVKVEPGSTPDVGLPLSPLSEDPYTTEIKHFYDCLIHNKPFLVMPEEALAALQIGLAALESINTGKPITLASLPKVS